MPYTWILFDADNTLFDYDRAEATALERTLVQFGCGFEDAYLDAYRRINEQIWRDYEEGKITQARLKTQRFVSLFEAVGLNTPPDAAVFSDHYLLNLGDCVYLVDGAEAVLWALRGKIHLALITNGLTAVQRSRLAQSSIGHVFEAVTISEEVGAAKPDPAIFDIAFTRMGRPRKENVLLVGDSLTSDIRGGNVYGMDTCWFNPARKPRPADVNICYEIDALAAVLEIVGL